MSFRPGGGDVKLQQKSKENGNLPSVFCTAKADSTGILYFYCFVFQLVLLEHEVLIAGGLENWQLFPQVNTYGYVRSFKKYLK